MGGGIFLLFLNISNLASVLCTYSVHVYVHVYVYTQNVLIEGIFYLQWYIHVFAPECLLGGMSHVTVTTLGGISLVFCE